jgi:hypothetical protein
MQGFYLHAASLSVVKAKWVEAAAAADKTSSFFFIAWRLAACSLVVEFVSPFPWL